MGSELIHHDCHNSHTDTRSISTTPKYVAHIRPDIYMTNGSSIIKNMIYVINSCLITTSNKVSLLSLELIQIICTDNSHHIHGHEKNGDRDGGQGSQAGA
uniref:Uncharacterized protein n=1 Tax=Arundo donax TaxID=35708 RepID=A0A0A9HWP5_ARUDO